MSLSHRKPKRVLQDKIASIDLKEAFSSFTKERKIIREKGGAMEFFSYGDERAHIPIQQSKQEVYTPDQEVITEAFSHNNALSEEDLYCHGILEPPQEKDDSDILSHGESTFEDVFDEVAFARILTNPKRRDYFQNPCLELDQDGKF